jgi:hypothetical protein
VLSVFSKRVLHNIQRPTKRALDAGVRCDFSGVFLASDLLLLPNRIHALSSASNANRRD